MRLKGKDVYTSETDRKKIKEEKRYANWSMGVDYSSKVAYPILCVVMVYYFIVECLVEGGKAAVLNQIATLNKVSMIALIISTVALGIWCALYTIDSVQFLVRHIRETSEDNQTFSYFFFEMMMNLCFIGIFVVSIICVVNKYYEFGTNPAMFGALCGVMFCIATFNIRMESVDELDKNIMNPLIASATCVPAGMAVLIKYGQSKSLPVSKIAVNSWYGFLGYFGLMNAIVISGILCVLMVYGVCYRIKMKHEFFHNSIARTFGLIIFIMAIILLVFFHNAPNGKGEAIFIGVGTLIFGLVCALGFLLSIRNAESDLDKSFVLRHMSRRDDEIED